jgi:hypothetical protein
MCSNKLESLEGAAYTSLPPGVYMDKTHLGKPAPKCLLMLTVMAKSDLGASNMHPEVGFWLVTVILWQSSLSVQINTWMKMHPHVRVVTEQMQCTILTSISSTSLACS